MPRRATVCPRCGEPVSVFAAGCAICGEDLERHRRELRSHAITPPRVPGRLEGLRARLDAHVALVAVTVLAVLLSPLLGLLLAALGAHDRHRSGRIGQRNLFLVLAAIDVLLLLIPGFRFGILSLLYG